MIKARGIIGGTDTVIIGLSRRNTELLHDGKPILFDGLEVGLPVRILMLAGDTENDVIEDLRSIGFNLPEGAPDA